jgi:hypothetical protein
MKTFALTAALAGSIALSANAAMIDYEVIESVNVITVVGRIDKGDEDRFNTVASAIDGDALVVLNSPGGLIVDGLDIGIMIRRKGYRTFVPEDAVCASVCGLIWLAGSDRGLSPRSKIGFHAAARDDGEESGTGNALVGAYLTNLGFAYDAVVYMTSAAPDDMRWLTPEIAARLGITYALINPMTEAEPKPFMGEPSRPSVPPAAPVPSAPPPSAEQAARTPAYARGRQARIEYEQWFANLTEGSAYKDGAKFWATHRSDKPAPPDCVGAPEWVAGCVTARIKLAPSDLRRATDKNFWYGWNSL